MALPASLIAVTPTRRCALVFAAGLPISVLPAVISPRMTSLWVAYLVAAVLATLADGLLAPTRRRFRVVSEAPELVYIGEAPVLEVAIDLEGWPRAVTFELRCVVESPLAPPPVSRLEVPAGAVATAHLPLVPLRRGTAAIRTLWLRWRGPFGLMQRRACESVDKPLPIAPNLRAVRAVALRFFSNREFLSGLKMQHYIGDGSEFESLREYMPGLDHRAIDWKASARHKKLLCREFRAERDHQVFLAFDTGHLMAEQLDGLPRLDHAINAGLLLGYVCLKTGDRVGLFGFDERVRLYWAPQAGVQTFNRLQALAAELDYGTGETNFTLGLTHLLTRLRRRSLVVVFTEFVDTISAELMVENLARLAHRHLVLFVSLEDRSLTALRMAAPRSLKQLNQSVVAGDFQRERELVLKRLARSGVQCISATPEQVSAPLINRYLDIKRRELV